MLGHMQHRPLTVPSLLEHVEGQYGHKTVTTYQVGHVMTASFSELAVRIRKMAGVLDDLEVPVHARVGTFGQNTQRHLELYMAVPSSNRVIHTINHRLFTDQLAYIIDDAADDVLFVDRSVLGGIWDVISERASVRHVVVMDDGDDSPVPDDPRISDYEELMRATTPFKGAFDVDDERTAAALCYTSGTTGSPKGVLYDHRSIILHALLLLSADSFGLRNSDVILPIVPMFHVNAWGLPYAALMCGADLVLPGTETSPESLVGQLSRHSVTFAAAVATVWRAMTPYVADRDLGSLRKILCGGGVVPLSLSKFYLEQVGLPLTNGWGMTETSPVVTGARQEGPASTAASADERVEMMSSPGVALPLTSLRLSRDDEGGLVPHDGHSRGELQVAGPTIAGSYFGSNVAQESFTDDGWLCTGDIATIDPYGNLRIVDRTKDLIKSGGEWISSVQLENEIMADSRVKEAAVIAKPDERWGERPVACVVPADGVPLGAQEIREFLASRVANWWIPEEVVVLEEIPKTATGKFSKVRLREQLRHKNI